MTVFKAPIGINVFDSKVSEVNNLKTLENLKKKNISVDTSLCSQEPPLRFSC